MRHGDVPDGRTRRGAGPSRPGGRRDQTSSILIVLSIIGKGPMKYGNELDELARESGALRNFLEQRDRAGASTDRASLAVAALTGDGRGPLVYDLSEIHRAA